MRNALFLFLFIAGCSVFDTNQGIDQVEITPRLDSYTYSDTTIVEMELINHTEKTVYFSTCDQQQIEKLVNGRSVDTFNTISACLCICIVEIKPGDAASYAYSLGMMSQTAQAVENGQTYRIWPVLYEANSLQRKLPRHLINVKSFKLDVVRS